MLEGRTSQHERSAAKIAAGLCRYCGKVPFRSGVTSCDNCADRKKRSQQALRQKRIAQGICAHCGKRRPKATSLVCEQCTPRGSRPRSEGGGTPERKKRVGDLKYLSFVEPIADHSRKRRSSESGYYYLVEIRSLARVFRKVFTITKYGGRSRAYVAALGWRNDKLDALGIPKDSSAPFFSRPYQIITGKDHSTGIVGVSYHRPSTTHAGYFSAYWRENGNPRFKSFWVSTHGFEGALELAMAHRRKRLRELYGEKMDRLRGESVRGQLQPTNHVFISYVREDRSQVEDLCEALESAGIQAWVDRKDILHGERWRTAIRTAIKDGAFFIACFSSRSLTRDKSYMNEEITLAIEELRQRPTDRSWFIPILLSPCELPDRSIGAGATLRDLQWVSLFDDWKAGVDRIKKAINKEGLRSALRKLQE